MPKVLRILNRNNIGGPVLNVCLLTKYLSPEYETLLISGPPLPDESEATEVFERFGVKPLYIKEMGRSFNFINDFKAFLKIRKIIREFKPDIVHTHAAKPGILGRLAAKMERVPAIVHTYHGHVFHSYYSPFITSLIIRAERFLGKLTHKIIAISDLQQNELCLKFKIAPNKKFEVVNLGLFLEPFQSKIEDKRRKFRDEFNLKNDTIVISIIGRLVPIKNHKFFIEVVSKLIKLSEKSIKAFIVGGGEEQKNIILEIEKYGLRIFNKDEPLLEYDIVLTSWRSDIDTINAGSDIIALTSFNEGTPVSLIEAQACGRPVISTDCGGVHDSVRDGVTGFVCPQGDLLFFTEKLEVLINNSEVRQKMGIEGQAFVSEKFSHVVLIQKINKLYNNLLG
jgi:glycosyltransferase involved in cell wall biosynthesis